MIFALNTVKLYLLWFGGKKKKIFCNSLKLLASFSAAHEGCLVKCRQSNQDLMQNSVIFNFDYFIKIYNVC